MSKWNKYVSFLIAGVYFCIPHEMLLSQKRLSSSIAIARLKYSGGGDWYNDPSAIPNLARFIKSQTDVDIAEEEVRVVISDEALFAHPIVFLTGHGRMSLSDDDAKRLRTYLLRGGFLIVDDDYGLDSSFREAMKKVFPGRELQELPFSHDIYHVLFSFPDGLPKIHEHDGGPPKGYGIFHEGKLVVFYAFNTNISDGWPDPQIHGDPEEKRIEAFKMGTNIFIYALSN